MDTFLDQSAQYIFNNHAIKDLKNIQIILPSRRAVFFFKKSLAALSEKPFLSPNVVSIDDFIIQKSSLMPVDLLELYFKMYDLFLELDATLTFEKFINWATILIKDFENIDMALIENPHLLFKYMSEAEALKRWQLDISISPSTHLYFDFFDRISIVYDRLRNQLLDKNQCYKGMAYKKVALDDIQIFNDYQYSYFVGLNALSNAEEQIVKKMVKAKLAECLWDSDDYYMKTDNKAGKKLRNYKNSGAFGEWKFQNDLIKTTAKNIQVFDLKNDSLQTKLALQLTKNKIDEKQVIVVLNESQFYPLMVNFPSITENFNITMGVPIKNSTLYNVIDFLIDFQIKIQNERDIRFPMKSMKMLLNNNVFIEILKNIGIFNTIKASLKNENALFLNKNWLGKNELNSPIISCFFEKLSVHELILTIENIATVGLNHLSALKFTLEHEFLTALLKNILAIRDIFIQRKNLSHKDLAFLLNELIKNDKVPLTGSTDANIQIMSMLETRCLDFENVTILSTNEGDLPSIQKNKSFIPFDAALIFGLPVYSDQDAIMAYHFFRLLQRAENINLLYLSSSTNGMAMKEKSRFIAQIEQELLPYNPNIQLNYVDLAFSNTENLKEKSIKIEKTEEILGNIRTYLSQKGLYPTAINDFAQCSLKFYWKEIERQKQKEESNENFGANDFGNIIHLTLEYIETPFLNDKKAIGNADLKQIKDNLSAYLDKTIKLHFAKFDTNYGLNSVFKDIALQILQKYFDLKIENYSDEENILILEKTLTFVKEFEISDSEKIAISINGKVDKISRIKDDIFVIDYKTGSVNDTELKITKEKIAKFDNPDNKILRQLMMYRYLANKDYKFLENIDIQQFNILPSIISFRKLSQNYTLSLKEFSQTEIDNLIESYLEKMVKQLLDESISFDQTTELDFCEYCNFKSICNR